MNKNHPENIGKDLQDTVTVSYGGRTEEYSALFGALFKEQFALTTRKEDLQAGIACKSCMTIEVVTLGDMDGKYLPAIANKMLDTLWAMLNEENRLEFMKHYDSISKPPCTRK